MSISTCLYILRRSRVKREILLLLASSSGKLLTLSEIARLTNNYPLTVYGALYGLKGHFKKELSLINLGLVKVVEKDSKKYYKISIKGKIILSYIMHNLEKNFSIKVNLSIL